MTIRLTRAFAPRCYGGSRFIAVWPAAIDTAAISFIYFSAAKTALSCLSSTRSFGWKSAAKRKS
jgi:hypothetical protein